MLKYFTKIKINWYNIFMKETSVIDIISPIMIGPSSSHTAGAVRLGLLARKIFGEQPNAVIFKLYNSYAQTGKGHGTEKGLLAGVLNYSIDDRNIKTIFEQDLPIKYKFEYYDDYKKHPNGVDFVLESDNRRMTIYGESVGAGEVCVRMIDGFSVKLTGKLNTLMLVYDDVPGMISKVTSIIQPINIASLHCDRYAKGEGASMCICIDGELQEDKLNLLKEIDRVYFVSYIRKL